jgi:hypothetical protein
MQERGCLLAQVNIGDLAHGEGAGLWAKRVGEKTKPTVNA